MTFILIVAVPPKISVLLDEKGSEVADIVGPYNVGGTLILTCDILGGKTFNYVLMICILFACL